jgi:endo-1,4-beta-xylanase
MQGHWGLDYPPLNELDDALSAYSKLDVNVMITEFDMDMLPSPSDYTGAEITQNYKLEKKYNPYTKGLPDSMQIVLSKRYTEFFKLFNKYKDSISRITFWGVHDGQSWRNYWPIKGRTAYPLLFNRDLSPKPAFFSVIKTAEN